MKAAGRQRARRTTVILGIPSGAACDPGNARAACIVEVLLAPGRALDRRRRRKKSAARRRRSGCRCQRPDLPLRVRRCARARRHMPHQPGAPAVSPDRSGSPRPLFSICVPAGRCIRPRVALEWLDNGPLASLWGAGPSWPWSVICRQASPGAPGRRGNPSQLPWMHDIGRRAGLLAYRPPFDRDRVPWTTLQPMTRHG
jgi:hypothetical protein